jgi:GntR family transcriptional regulator / MocR family aminotransferase
MRHSNGPRSALGLALAIDRGANQPLGEQVRARIADAIMDGTLAPGARLPSWRDLASQLGVARGTVRQAYDDLADAQLVIAAGARGTRVTDHPPRPRADTTRIVAALPATRFPYVAVEPRPLQIGVPSQSGFPSALWGRLARQAMRDVLGASIGYPDPRGELGLRREIASHLAVARGLACDPEQILVTSGYGAGLALVLRVLDLGRAEAWMEDPGYFVARETLRRAGLVTTPVPVDNGGMNVEAALARAPGARLALVTPGQHAPLGATLSRSRRQALLAWAAKGNAWIIEDDYLAELQLEGRVTRALASVDVDGRTIYVSSFSKTVSPAIRLGFIVVPPPLVEPLMRAAALGLPAPTPVIQHAMMLFLRDGHYLRHLRRMKSLYRRGVELLRAGLTTAGVSHTLAGLALLVRLPPGADDRAVVARARALGFAPSALSGWYADAAGAPGLLLGVTNLDAVTAKRACAAIHALVRGVTT